MDGEKRLGEPAAPSRQAEEAIYVAPAMPRFRELDV